MSHLSDTFIKTHLTAHTDNYQCHTAKLSKDIKKTDRARTGITDKAEYNDPRPLPRPGMTIRLSVFWTSLDVITKDRPHDPGNVWRSSGRITAPSFLAFSELTR